MVTWRDDGGLDTGKFTIVDSDGIFSHPVIYADRAIQQASAVFTNGNVIIAYKGYQNNV